MANAVIGSWGRWTEEAVFTLGSWQSDYPSSNLSVLPLAKVARTSDTETASAQFQATLSRRRPVQLIAFIRSNISPSGKIRMKLYDDGDLTALLYSTGWTDFWPQVYQIEDLDIFDESALTLKYTDAQMRAARPPRPFWLDQVYYAGAVTVEIDDPDNLDEWIEFGLMEIAQGFQLPVNFGYGSQYGFRHRTGSVEAEGGVKYFARRDKPIVFQGSANYTPNAAAKTKFFEHFRNMDLDTPFFWLPDPDDQKNWLRDAFLARNVDPGLISHASAGRSHVPLRFEQVL